jgi:SAM-dependent methyltransferase
MTHVSTTEPGTPYALDNDEPTAAHILHCLAAILDENTVLQLEEVFDRPVAGRRCLELGAGNGSVAGWLARGPGGGGRGEIVAVDINPRHVRVPPAVSVLGLDVARDELPPGPWDLIHARLLLAHLPQRRDILRRCVDLLAPGGALVIEEWGAAGPSRVLSDPGGLTAALYHRYTDALMDVFAEQGNDPSWCVSVPAAMTDAGLTDVRTVAHAESWQGGSAGCQLPIAVSTELHDRLVAHGMDAGDLERLRARLAEPSTVLVGNLTWSTTGYKPAG